LTLEQLDGALHCLATHLNALERAIFCRTADLCRADVDCIFWDTTAVSCELDAEDEADETRRSTTLPPWRKRGDSQAGRDHTPPVVVGLALTRDGLPMRSWVFPGHTVDATTVAQGKAGLRGWRQRQHREAVVAALRQELARLDPQAPEHPKRAAELVVSQRYGRYLRCGLGGRLAIDQARLTRAARMEGKEVLLTNDDTLTPEDVGLRYTAMMLIEACCRRMTTTGWRLRPVYHWTAPRIVSDVKLCRLAMLLQRTAEIRTGDT